MEQKEQEGDGSDSDYLTAGICCMSRFHEMYMLDISFEF